ncbi:hypothetical protein [Wolbachia endosymbiont of Bemisia tabaci]|uniref:hypothetical protein n=1 Tax=Wolbachia endosymbiont of Bemisia tabaci TaxID=215173 RepID=UPI000D56148A|nr:hypothetical protein [Wolbachia endosymbiont of Bemisia tabaci]
MGSIDLTTHKEIKALIESRKNTNNNKDNITNAEKDNDVEIKTVDHSSTIQAEEQTSTFFDNFFSIITKPFSLIVSFFSGVFSWLFGSNEEKIDESISQPNASISLLPLDSSSEKKTDAQPSDHSLIVPDQSIGQSDSDGHLLG